jgi:CMP/dCMP kinase
VSRGPFIIAVDGPAASGKGTIATRLAAAYDLPALDSGLLYRAVGVTLEQQGGDLDDPEAAAKVARALSADSLDNPAFRTRAAGEAASRVAVHPAVRLALRQMQQDFAHRPGGAVIDGRDIGTVIAPDAPAKLYVTARPEVRAERRFRQLQAQGETVTFSDILDDIHRRDARDGGRSDSPMVAARDAVLLDTSQMTIDQAADAARRMVEAARARWLES